METTIDRIRALAAAWDDANGDEAFPADRLAQLADAGALTDFTTLADDDAVARLVQALRLIGGADLSLGRVFEGHVNAAQLVHAYGNAQQRATLADDLAAGRSFGVWNTEPAPGMTLTAADGGYRLSGAKCFATGAGHIDRALITARWPDGGKQLVLADIANVTDRADNAAWQVRGMKGTASGTFDFDGLVVGDAALIGAPGDYEREPRFSAGAWRFTAVQLGAVEALIRHWRDHLVATGKGADPIQRARFATAVAATRSAGLWVVRAARLAEAARPEAIAQVLMTRGVVEDAALLVMEGAARAIGTAAFFFGSRVDRITRDLGLYLRQPVPDQARDRAAAAWLEADCWGDDPWW
ncbi:acyl-CoA dehydrogenase [Sphingomonas sp. KR1UV-12]|uniref:Acyl-CoA dehydrogenase n=1 Tax=Sphingomonas aurea TaxID=3063994 RepID=A0ABT9EG89_9SPHN|nr:acyl-CoA dehydrogenase [Sphingomonas sp. KR1UV-12]MDP1025909.1 acyl-CoA dehydrogenase [Sphingomonas sp. KR1UV-12]